jgi:mRNA degradation ribonuclease J1/J2
MKMARVHHASMESYRKSESPLLTSLLVAGAIFSICFSAFAQNPAVRNPTEATRASKTLTATTQRANTSPARRVFVRSKSLLVRAAVVEEKLLKRPEFQQLGFAITREESDADLILELRHDLLTKYVFSVVDVRTKTLLAGGKLSSLGGTVAEKVAKRFVKEMARVPAP